ncbi:MAG: OmpA family protein [Gammaproteobacteria bacterium]|nr:OmpA family protein [Gammaproteobacteria bacterium]
MNSYLQKFNRTQKIHFSNEWIAMTVGLILCLLSVVAVAETAVTTAAPVEEQNIVTESDVLKEINDIETNQEMHLPVDEAYTAWEMGDVEQIDDKIEKKNVLEQEVTTKKLKNIVPPIQFKSGGADIPENYIELLRDALDKVKHRHNVRLHFIGHSDDQKLSGRLKKKYTDNVGLSRERAGTTAEYFQKALKLPPEAISYDGKGEHEPLASNKTSAGRAINRRVEVQVWYDEIHEKIVEKDVVIAGEMTRIKVCRIETVCKLRYQEGHSKRARIKNLVAPLQFKENVSGISEQFLRQISQAMSNLKGKENVTVKLIGHTDNIPLAGREERIYGTHTGLSKARARRAALAVQEALKLPNRAITSDGRGADSPIASNDSDKGRTLNRRIEVEFWYDDALAELPDEPQVCPEQATAETVTRVYEPPSGNVQPVYFDKGKPVMPLNYDGQLAMILKGMEAKTNARLRFVGFTANERLDRRTMMIYGDDIGLSTARALRVKELVQKALNLTDKQVEHEGRGDVQSADVVNTGFSDTDSSHVLIEAIYDDLATLEEEEGLEITRFKRVVKLKDPYALNLMRITVDGKPLHDPNKSTQDMQRCTDTALEKANVQLHYDGLELKPRLNITAWPSSIRYKDKPETEHSEDEVRFKIYSNYPSFISKSEVRIFDEKQSERDTPLAVVELDANGYAQWRANFEDYQAPDRELKYLLRVYDKNGSFDQTESQPLWVVDEQEPGLRDRDAEKELLIGFGKNRLSLENIIKTGGTIRVNGTDIPENHNVWVAGRTTPISDDGKFIFEEIIPVGLHTLEVAVLDENGGGELFLRDLKLDSSEWFYVGIADVTASTDNTNGPAQLVTGDQTHYDNDLAIDGRIAYYIRGKFWTDWELTSSLDTLEGPIDDVFSNFMNKSPDALFRRMDPDYYYPTYGDDGTVEEGAPTLGKFYFKLSKGTDHLLWGNFKTSYTDNDLAHVDRGLYGINGHYETDEATSFGEKIFSFDGFVADPGTVAGRDEFRGTGGSLYFLRHQDVLQGSDRVRIEIRDKDSGMVVGVKNLSAVLDYDIDYLQGRIMLSEPLSGTVTNDMLISNGGSSGDFVHLVVRYEYTPGFDEIDTVITGGRSHAWFADMIKLGITTTSTDDGVTESSLTGIDLTLRKTSNTWLKIQSASSLGLGPETLISNDGGFDFTTIAQPVTTNVSADASRIDISLALNEMFADVKGSFTAYKQDLDAGYSAPGVVATGKTEQAGGSLNMVVTEEVNLKLKIDKNHLEQGLKTSANEINIDYSIDSNWTTSLGYRKDKRNDDSVVVPLTQKQGDRNDILLKGEYDSKQKWTSYLLAQNTLSVTGNREENSRVGVGGTYRTSDRFKLNGEVSTGDLGSAAKLGTEYLYNDRNTLYTNYSLDNERTDNGLSSRRGNMVTGVKSQYSDSASIYVEEKYTHGDVPTGLTNTVGIDLTPDDKWNFGARIDIGSLQDNNTGAITSRNAYGVDVGYGFESIMFASALEYRVDETEDSTTTSSERTTWLSKNSLKYQLTPSWRFISKLNISESKSTLGEFYNGDFTEAVLGYGYRPVMNDRLNALFKYTYFYNMPTTDQVTIANTAADFIQKSNIMSLDMTYDLTRNWSLGGKYGYRAGEIAYDRIAPVFFENDAFLYVLRADLHLVNKWDLLIEGRALQQPDIGDSRSGMLTGFYRQMNKNVKLGIGYNFTDFSDDLTDLDYDSKGWFINVVGKI